MRAHDDGRMVAAQRVVEARLGRPPQDMLEAAVVLEAWGGLTAGEALVAGEALMAETPPSTRASAPTPPTLEPRDRLTFESVAFVIAVLAIVCWTAPLATRVNPGALRSSLMVALPLTLVLQWWLRSRYLGRPRGLELLGAPRWLVPAFALALATLPAAVFGSAGLVAGLLVLVWSGGTILVMRHWSVGYVAVVVLASGAMAADLDALLVLATVAAVTGLATVAAVWPAPRATVGVRPGRWGRAVAAGLIGGAVGVILVADRTAGWGDASTPALSLLPSAVASVWAGFRLWQFQKAIPVSLAGLPPDARERRGLGAPLRILLSATVWLVFVTVVLSAALLLGASLVGVAVSDIGVLIGFGLVALATLLVSLLEAIGRSVTVLAALACAIAAEILMQTQDMIGFSGAGLVVGATVAIVLTAPVAVLLMSRPATTLATSLWIP